MDEVLLNPDYDSTKDFRILEVHPELRDVLTSSMFVEGTARVFLSSTATAADPTLPKDGIRQEDKAMHVLDASSTGCFISSRNATFLVRKVEYSNSLIVSSSNARRPANKRVRAEEDADARCSESSVSSSFVWQERQTRMFEVSKSRPRLDSVFARLKKDYASITDLEEESIQCPLQPPKRSAMERQHCTYKKLAQLSGCSVGELKDALVSAGAVVIDGFVRLVHPDAVADIISAVVMHLDASVDDAVSGGGEVLWGEAVVSYFSGIYPLAALDVARSLITTPSAANPAMCRVNMPACMVHLARRALASLALADGHLQSTLPPAAREELFDNPGESGVSSGATAPRPLWVPLEAFMDKWKPMLPFRFGSDYFAQTREELSSASPTLEGVTNSKQLHRASSDDHLLHALRGFVIVRTSGSGLAMRRDVLWCPHTSLPSVVEPRVRLLFQLCPGKWIGPELKAFVEPILDPGTAFEAAVSRVCKDVRVPGQSAVMYSLLS